MVGWHIHADQDPEEFIHTISDFVHYLMLQPLTSPLTLSQIFDLKQSENVEEQEINEDGDEEAKEGSEDEKGIAKDKAKQSRDEKHDPEATEEEKPKEDRTTNTSVKKASKDLEEKAKEKEKTKQGSSRDKKDSNVGKVPLVRHREKGPTKMEEGDEAWIGDL